MKITIIIIIIIIVYDVPLLDNYRLLETDDRLPFSQVYSDTQYIASFSGGLPDNIYLYVLQWQAIRRRYQTSDIVHCRVTVPDS